MYPTFEILNITFHLFGVILSVTWLLFFILLHHFSQKRGIIRPVFGDIVVFTLTMFIFARVFHIFGDWLNEKFILLELTEGNFLEFLRLFFTPQNYFFSLFGAAIGFFIVFWIKTKTQAKERARYIDAIAPAFLIAAILGYFGALLGGQVFGIPYSGPLSIGYDHIDSIVKDKARLFPLALVYMMMIGGILIAMWKVAQKRNFPDGIVGLFALGAYSGGVFVLEFLSGGRKDIFYDYFGLGLNQIGALIAILFIIVWIMRIIEKKI